MISQESKNYYLSEPVFLRNLLIFPIKEDNGIGYKRDAHERFSLSTIDETLTNKTGAFRELDTPDVNEIIFDNQDDSPVLMLDGEEITGSLQNRIIATSNFVAAKTSQNIPVVCVEEGRWNDIGGFETGYCSYPLIRTILAKSLHKKIDTQQVIWHEINRKLTTTKIISKTSSMHDIYDSLQAEILRYVEDFQSINHNTIGFVGVAGNRILGCDIFADPQAYHRFENKLVRSYALDAIEYQKKADSAPDVERFFADVLIALAKKKIRAGKNVKIKGEGFLGQALIEKSRPMHLSAFPV